VAALLCWAVLVGVPGISGASAGTPDAPPVPGASAGLIERLAVLQRPQTAADMLPSGLKLPRFGQGTVIPALTRLVATPAGDDLYLVVFTPARSRATTLWSPKLGDQVGLVLVTSDRPEPTGLAPAVDLTNGHNVTTIGAGSGYYVGIVPDGVARVGWTFANVQGNHRYSVGAQAANNVVLVPVHPGAPFLLRATWYAADGGVIPTSEKPLLHAITARQNIQRRQIIRQDARIRYRPAPALLAAFTVFNVTSRTGVKVAGLTISHPRLSSLPLTILSITARAGAPGRFAPELDPGDIRQATTRTGVSVWIIPGARGLCVAEVDQARFPFPGGSGAGMSCSQDVASAVASGSGLSSGSPGRLTWHYGVLPNTQPTLTIRTGPHSHRTIHLSDGVYIYRTNT
jgi:hypothetical protein